MALNKTDFYNYKEKTQELIEHIHDYMNHVFPWLIINDQYGLHDPVLEAGNALEDALGHLEILKKKFYNKTRNRTMKW